MTTDYFYIDYIYIDLNFSIVLLLKAMAKTILIAVSLSRLSKGVATKDRILKKRISKTKTFWKLQAHIIPCKSDEVSDQMR